MKIRLTRNANQIASALLTALVICSILSLFVMYYLSLIEQQSLLNARSQTWNMAIAVSEAGIEEGLQQVNSAYPDMATDGWTYDGSTCFWKSNMLADGNSYVSYIYITNAMNPTVISRAYVTPPTFFPLTGTLLFAVGGGGSVSAAPVTVTRSVQVTCSKKTPWTAAMIAKKNIDLNGNNVSTDSFNSSDPSESVNGQYNANYYRGSRGDIATCLGIIDSINAGNADIFGHAHTMPGSASSAVQVGPQGYIGSWPQSGTGVQSGWWLPDANFTFPSTYYPDTSGFFTPTGGVVVTTSLATNTTTVNSLTYPSPVPSGLTTNSTYYSRMSINPTNLYAIGTFYGVTSQRSDGNTWWFYYLISSYSYPSNFTTTVYSTNNYNQILWGTSDINHTNYYVASSLSGSTLVIGTNVVLALPNGLNMGNSDTIAYSPQPGANLIVYSGGTACTVYGNGVLNSPGYAADFILYCAPTVTSFTLNGNGTFVGVVVAPSADVSLNGGGSTPTDFVGCMMVNSVTLNGQFNFHYDEALGGNKSFGRFLITSWNEIPH